MAQLVGPLSRRLKGCRFNSQSRHMPMLRVWSLVGMHVRRQPINVSLSHRYFSLSFFLPLPLSLKTMKKCPQVRGKRKRSRQSPGTLVALLTSDRCRIGETEGISARTNQGICGQRKNKYWGDIGKIVLTS